jgi:hypothetical protein
MTRRHDDRRKAPFGAVDFKHATQFHQYFKSTRRGDAARVYATTARIGDWRRRIGRPA